MANIDWPEDEEEGESEGDDRWSDVMEEGAPDVARPRDLDELCDSLQGLPPADVEREIRSALNKVQGEVNEPDVLGLVLRVFRVARDAALDDYGDWQNIIGLCNLLTTLCDKSSMGFAGGADNPEYVEGQDLPASMVGSIYAECGRTLAIAGSDRLKQARDRLQIALNVFGIIPESLADENIQRQTAAATASLARVQRRLGQDVEAQKLFLQALQRYAELPPGKDTGSFISEVCEVIAEMDRDDVAPSLPSLLADMAEEKFGEGSRVHMQCLKEIGMACQSAGCIEYGATAMATRATILRVRCGGNTMELAEAQCVEEDAAAALEAAMPSRLQEGDLQGAISCWEQALAFREDVEGPECDIVIEMRKTLQALKQAADGQPGNSTEDDTVVEEEEEAQKAKAATPVAASWDEEDDEKPEEPSPAAAEAATKLPPAAQKASLSAPITSLTGAPGMLRPKWAKTTAAAAPAASTSAASTGKGYASSKPSSTTAAAAVAATSATSAEGPQASNDAWD
eukprot:TRINITY_DN719_c5_g1_i1.p1 TRINITY_DN719_c5_g1~~TRINITY_DN719_c5_g1_i1.p1  ORF type:complete len:513 (-),score=163.08 TRINITY_DN719_c5_g1_i1:134-1672(-)